MVVRIDRVSSTSRSYAAELGYPEAFLTLDCRAPSGRWPVRFQYVLWLRTGGSQYRLAVTRPMVLT